MSSAPIRVLCCSSSLEGGGSERQIAALVRHLDRSRFAPELFLLRREGVHLDSIPGDVPIHCYQDACKPKLLHWPGREHSRQVRYLATILKSRGIFLLYDRTYHMTQITGPATLKTGVPRISTVVSPPQSDFENCERHFRWLKRKLLSKAYRNADRVIAVSRGVAIEVQKYYHVPSDHVRVIYSPVDQDDILNKANQSTTSAKPSDNHPLRIACIGRLSQEKGHIYLLQAIRIVAKEYGERVQLDIVGDGPLKAALTEWCREQQIDSSVNWHGYLTNPYPLLKSTELLCLPSLYEGLPNVVMEAMLLKVPVLAADCPTGPRELLGENLYGTLVTPANPRQLADAILDRIRNPQKWIAKTDSAQSIIHQRHSMQAWINTMQDCFLEIANSRKQQ
jgi:glycosyltransferase involved in cell wall biosynthesis